MKLTTITMVTVDGVMQGLGEPDEDRRGGHASAVVTDPGIVEPSVAGPAMDARICVRTLARPAIACTISH